MWRRLEKTIAEFLHFFLQFWINSADPACERFRVQVLKQFSNIILKKSKKISRIFQESSEKNLRLRGGRADEALRQLVPGRPSPRIQEGVVPQPKKPC